MDFTQGMLATGQRFRTLNVLGTVTRECLRIEVDTSLPDQRVRPAPRFSVYRDTLVLP